MNYYKKAKEIDADNRFLLQNMPPRLMRMAENTQDDDENRKLLEEAYTLSIRALDLPEREDRVFAMINIIDVLSESPTPPLNNIDHDLGELVREVEGQRHAVNLDDEAWLVLAKANIFLGDIVAAEKNLSSARASARDFNDLQLEALAKLEKEIEKLKQPTSV